MPNRRQSAATAATGYGLVGAGGAIRGGAIDEAHHQLGFDVAPKQRAFPSSLAVYGAHKHQVPGARRIVRRFAGGTALATVGAPAAGLGTYELMKRRRRVAKADPVTQGVQGVGQAWKQKGQSLKSGAPARTRLIPISVGTAGGGLGALAAHRALDQVNRVSRRAVPGKARAAITAMAAVPGTVATVPLSRRLVRRTGYTVTPTGTHKVAKVHNPDNLPTLTARGTKRKIHARSGDHAACGTDGAFGHGMGPFAEKPTEVTCRGCLRLMGVSKASQDYHGRHVPYRQQRAATMGVGVTPVVGPLLAARQAASYAPPGQQRRAAARQIAAPAAGIAAGFGASRAAYHHAQKSPAFARGAERVYRGAERQRAKLPAKARRLIPMKDYAKLGHRAPAIAAGAIAYKAVSSAVGIPGSQLAISRDIRAQKKYDKRRRFGTPSVNEQVHKAADGMNQGQRRTLVRRKRTAAAINVAGGTAGLTALALAGAKKPALLAHRERAIVVGAGIGGVGAFNAASINHREAKAEHKAISKAQPIQTNMHENQAHKIVHGPGGVGTKGPLPKHLNRAQRMDAYQARYIATGGHKANKWQHVADNGDRARNAGLGGGLAAGAAWLGATSPKTRKLVAPMRKLKHFESLNSDAVKHKAERSAVAAATIGAGGELTEEGAKRRRASYSSSPGGVAASALRRMQAYTP